ncbi:collagen-binding domain-containing protein [Micropruina sonneratiae]|uniref:collagen-binding domain-containing protein n=1 Tax=Micropruina sonneratiae TaxID=2986940 RepID=UPI002226B00A|nr:collagen-binding domain-containing protein [Micropruina sp. KQZ13P-5]MCW3157965.1 hypothetical protein [Micropruina sp. KQZ13P-5]
MRGFTPYEASNGFTVVGRGDVTLNNGELEGSGAAFGTIAAGRENYPIVHMAAGQADYAAPTVDGRSVRILAGAFVGTGSLDISNRNAPTARDLNATGAHGHRGRPHPRGDLGSLGESPVRLRGVDQRPMVRPGHHHVGRWRDPSRAFGGRLLCGADSTPSPSAPTTPTQTPTTPMDTPTAPMEAPTTPTEAPTTPTGTMPTPTDPTSSSSGRRPTTQLPQTGSGADPGWLAAGLGVAVTGLVVLIGSRLAGQRR